jgi:hypothetical protein
MEKGNSQAILLARRPRTKDCARSMREGKDNLAIPFIGWMSQEEIDLRRLLKKPASKAAGESKPEAYPLGRMVRRIRSTTSVRAAESVRRPSPR